MNVRFRRISRRNPAKTGVFPMTRADSASVLIPPGSPLAIGWRADVAALLIRHGLAEMMEVLTAFAELCRRREPDTARDPLDCTESLTADGQRRTGRPNCGPSTVLTVARIADPARRRIKHKAELLAAEKVALLRQTRMPHPSRIPGRRELARQRRVQVVS
jgi:hypothetical protein